MKNLAEEMYEGARDWRDYNQLTSMMHEHAAQGNFSINLSTFVYSKFMGRLRRDGFFVGKSVEGCLVRAALFLVSWDFSLSKSKPTNPS